MLHIEAQNVEATRGIEFASSRLEVHEIRGAATNADEAQVNAIIEAIAGRLGQIPMFWQEEIRSELRIHLECLIAVHEEFGVSREEAIAAAARQFGDTRRIAGRYRRAWAQKSGCETPGQSMREASVCFAAAMARQRSIGFGLDFGSRGMRCCTFENLRMSRR